MLKRQMYCPCQQTITSIVTILRPLWAQALHHYNNNTAQYPPPSAKNRDEYPQKRHTANSGMPFLRLNV